MKRAIVCLGMIVIGSGCAGGGGEGSDPVETWPEVEVFCGEVEGVSMGASMSGDWASVAGSASQITQAADTLMKSMPASLKGKPAEAKAKAVQDSVNAFAEACETKDGAKIEAAFKKLEADANALLELTYTPDTP